jgi:hypothetical protein
MAKLPQFKDDDEFADFVDTHDMADYWDEFEDVEIVKVKRPKKKAITIRLYAKPLSCSKTFAPFFSGVQPNHPFHWSTISRRRW